VPSLLQQAARKRGIDLDTEQHDQPKLEVYRDTGEAILKQLARLKRSRFTAGAIDVFVDDLGAILADLTSMRLRRSAALADVVSAHGAWDYLSQAHKLLRQAADWLEQDDSVEQDVPARNRRSEAFELVTSAYSLLLQSLEHLAPQHSGRPRRSK
jgi:hypothetical protein